MRRYLLILIWAVLGLLFLCSQSWAVCPEDPNDNGECDTLYVEIYPGDEHFMPPVPHYARFPIYVTHDVPAASVDSIAFFVIPLCYTSSNANANAVIDPAKNNTNLYPFPNIDNSIFRHLPDNDTRLVENWMMVLSEALIGLEWDTRILDMSEGNNFWMSLLATGSADQRFPEGSRVLLATATFTLQDTTTICIDTCFWPPAARLAFATQGSPGGYIPRHFLPIRERIFIPGHPPVFLLCPDDEVHYGNGTGFQSGEFRVREYDDDGAIVSGSAEFSGSGVENVHVVWNIPPPCREVSGHVSYDVTDCAEEGGTITITAVNDRGTPGFCDFDVMLPNNPPVLNLSDSWLALAGYTLVLRVSAADPENDSPVTVNLEAFWYQPDSLQAPTNAPSYYGGNPGFFNWVPEEPDTGIWVCSFSASDSFGCETTDQVAILVGMPFCGDCTGEGTVDVSDVVYLIGYLFKAGPAPDPLCKGDVTCDGTVEAGDLVYLINYFFRFGPAPCFECCP